MSFRFWRRIRIAPGIALNLSKSTASLSFGPRRAKYTVSPRGNRVTAGLPGTGLFYTVHEPRRASAGNAPRVVVLAKPQHAAQMQVYMHLTGITRSLYVAVCKDTDALHIERVPADPEMGERLLDKARRIIFAQHPPERISADPAWFECRFCDHHGLCHGEDAAAITCRSCLHSTPVEGGWHCARHDRLLDPADQRRACPRHLFIPDLVPGEVSDAGEDFVSYRMRDGSAWTNDAREKEAAAC